jgi:type VI secretion system secreted protein VgrG
MNTRTPTSIRLPGHSFLEACRLGDRGLLTLGTLLAVAACSTPPETRTTAAALDQTVLGTAQAFAVLGGSTVTNTGSTVVEGDLGVNPGLAVTGFPPGLVTGTIHAGDAVALQAQTDTTIAYVALAGEAPTADLTGQDLGGKLLTAGVYKFSSSAQLTGALTLDAQGDPNAVFVFQIGSTLTTASNASVVILNGGVDCNVFWQVGSSATLGTTTAFKGNILALTSITLDTGATVSGRALARNGAVTMDTNEVSLLDCTAPNPGPDAGPGPNPGPDAGPGPGPDAGVPLDGPVDLDGGVPADCEVDAAPPMDAPAPPADCEVDAGPVAPQPPADAGCDAP